MNTLTREQKIIACAGHVTLKSIMRMTDSGLPYVLKVLADNKLLTQYQ